MDAPIGQYALKVVVNRELLGPMLTTTRCTCKQTWTNDLGSCDSYCCNPDSDAVGAWCDLDSKHLGADGEQCGQDGKGWGYCDMSTAATMSKDLDLVILLNPYNVNSPEYTSEANREEYVEREEGLIWQGTPENNNAYQFDYYQHEYATLATALRGLRRMPIATRGNLVLLSRHISYYSGNELCYGKWSSPYTSGTPGGGYSCDEQHPELSPPNNHSKCYEATHWTDMRELLHMHNDLNGRMPVQASSAAALP